MKKAVLLLLALAGCLSLAACGKKAAPIVLPDPEKILSIDVTAGEVTHTFEDSQWIRQVIEGISGSAPTRKQSVQDTPTVKEYARIDFHHRPSGTSSLFTYVEKGIFYVEQPYQGIYEIDRELYQLMIEGPQPQNP